MKPFYRTTIKNNTKETSLSRRGCKGRLLPQIHWFILATILFASVGCAPSLAERKTAADLSMGLLQKSDFKNAALSAGDVLKEDAQNPYAALVKAISLYKTTMHQFFLDGRTIVVGAAVTRSVNTNYITTMVDQAQAQLTEVSRLLEVAAMEPQISLELCVACMDIDWNQNGRVDQMDLTLFAVERDAFDHSIDENDPRRRPTFRLDHGDVIWAQAFVSFHLAVLNLVTAYDLSEIPLFINNQNKFIRFKLLHPEQITAAQNHILQGLSYSLAARQAYLAETDDDREWLPNPVQKDHPIPLEVTTEFYETWELVATDLQKVFSGEESISVAALAQLGNHQWENPPRGFFNVGKLFTNAKDLEFDIEQLENHIEALEDAKEPQQIERLLEELFGFCYVKHAKSTPLLGRLDRMKKEVERGQESIERKLKYLFWVN